MLDLAKVTLYKDDEKVYENKNIQVKYNKLANTISYMDDVLTKIIFENQALIFKRIDDEYEFSLEIRENNLCNIYLKKEDITLDIEVEKAHYKREKDYLEIVYKIESDDALNKVVIVKN